HKGGGSAARRPPAARPRPANTSRRATGVAATFRISVRRTMSHPLGVTCTPGVSAGQLSGKGREVSRGGSGGGRGGAGEAAGRWGGWGARDGGTSPVAGGWGRRPSRIRGGYERELGVLQIDLGAHLVDVAVSVGVQGNVGREVQGRGGPLRREGLLGVLEVVVA